MSSNKSLIILLILLVVGFILFSTIAVGANISFAIGVIITSLIFWSRSTTETTKENKSLTEGTTLYVGNLSYKANESDVKELFEQHGYVHKVRLMKDKRTGKRRGFGFVEVSPKDTDTIIDTLNESEYMQRTIKVRVANEPKHPTTAEL